MVLRKVVKQAGVRLSDAPRVSNDPRFPDYYLYPTGLPYAGLPPCDTNFTWYVVAKSGGKLVQMLSVGKDGLRRGWDICGGCTNYFTRCTCAKLTPPLFIQRELGVLEGDILEQALATVRAAETAALPKKLIKAPPR